MSGTVHTTLIAQLDELVRTAALEECAFLLGHLERIKFVVLTKLAAGRDTAPEGQRKPGAPLSVHQVAERLNIPSSCVYELIRQQKLRAGKVGKYLRVSEAQLKQFEVAHGLREA